MSPRFLVLAVLAVSVPASAHATVRYVAPTTGACGGTPCYTTIRAALADPNLQSGDEILVRPGVYYERQTGSTTLRITQSNITLHGEAGKERETIIDGWVTGTCVDNGCPTAPAFPNAADYRILTVQPSAGALTGVLIENLTFRRSRLCTPTGDPKGGAAIALEYASGTIRSCRFENCVAFAYSGHGGAVAWYEGSGLIDSCYFAGNDAGYYGGALAVGDAAVDLTGSVFERNGRTGEDICWMPGCARGGAVNYFDNASGKIYRNVFRGNRCRETGGALGLVRGFNVDVQYNTFYADTAGSTDDSIVHGNAGGSAIIVLGGATEVLNLTLRNNVFAECVGYRQLNQLTGVVAMWVLNTVSSFTLDDGCNDFWNNRYLNLESSCDVTGVPDSSYTKTEYPIPATCGGLATPFCPGKGAMKQDPKFIAPEVGDFALAPDSPLLVAPAACPTIPRMGAYGVKGDRDMVVSISSPDGSAWGVGQSHPIAWSIQNCPTTEQTVGIDSVHVWAKRTGACVGGVDPKVHLESLVDNLAASCSGGSWSWMVNGPASSPTTAFVQAFPHSGNRVYGARSAAFEVDAQVPAVVGDLLATLGRTTGCIQWTAPGDDGGSGQAAEYDLRYSISAITNEATFAAATQVSGEPTPGPAGTPQTKSVNGLQACKWYYFAIKTRDNAGLWSGIGTAPAVKTECLYREVFCEEGVRWAGEVVPEGVELETVSEPGSGVLINFGVPHAFEGRPLELAMFDLAGRRVATLRSEPARAGRASVRWEKEGSPAQGVYFARLRVGGEQRRSTVIIND